MRSILATGTASPSSGFRRPAVEQLPYRGPIETHRSASPREEQQLDVECGKRSRYGLARWLGQHHDLAARLTTEMLVELKLSQSALNVGGSGVRLDFEQQRNLRGLREEIGAVAPKPAVGMLKAECIEFLD